MTLTEFLDMLNELVTKQGLEWFFEEFDDQYHLTILKASSTRLFSARREIHIRRDQLGSIGSDAFRKLVKIQVGKLKGEIC